MSVPCMSSLKTPEYFFIPSSRVKTIQIYEKSCTHFPCIQFIFLYFISYLLKYRTLAVWLYEYLQWCLMGYHFYLTHVFSITRVALVNWSKFPSQTVRDPMWFLILSSGLHWCCHRLRCSPADTYSRSHWMSQNFTYPPPLLLPPCLTLKSWE